MQKKYLASNQEFEQARGIEMRLRDQKRMKAAEPPPPALTGRTWLPQLSAERMKYVLDAMQTLRNHDIPLKDSAQQYVFRLDEYFIAHPDQPASDGAGILAQIIYENDPSARLSIDRWRYAKDQPPRVRIPAPFSGAVWLTLIHDRKMTYVAEAMNILKEQQVPMGRSAYAYEYALDELFTKEPELDASDSVVALASVLNDTEPEARNVLEALRLK
jgi:hypothetical protein